MGTRISPEKADEVRAQLRKLRTANPEMQPVDGQAAMAKLYDLDISRQSFYATYWLKSDPATAQDDDEWSQVEEDLDEEPSELFTLVGRTDGYMRFTADVIVLPEFAIAAAKALSGAVAE